MRTPRVIPALVIALVCTMTSTAVAKDTEKPIIVTGKQSELRLRLDAGLGPNICVNNGDARCDRWPEGTGASQDAAGYGRIGATLVYPKWSELFGASLLMGVSGYSASNYNMSTAFHLATLLRVFVPLKDEDVELTAGVGFGLATWHTDVNWSWIGLTLPVTLGLGYQMFKGWVIGADFTLQPRITGNAPFNAQLGLYVAYTLEMRVDDD